MADPVRLAFLGCGFITDVHSRHLRALRAVVTAGYASRNRAKADAYCRRFGGTTAYGSYADAINDPQVDAVVIAVPPRFHRELALRAIDGGKHVLVEKPAFPALADYEIVRDVSTRAGRVVMVGENDHYKPLAVTLRRLLADGAIGDMLFAHFTTIAMRLKDADDWRNDVAIAGGDAFFEEGIHWLHLAGSLGPTIVRVQAYRPSPSRDSHDRRDKSLMVAFQYDNSAAGSLYYSREVPSLFRGLRVSKLFGRRGVITFESNGSFVFVRGRGLPRILVPGLRDIRGYRAMYRDFAAAIREGRPAQMGLAQAMDDQRLMERIYASLPDPRDADAE
jgi:predicted dehydrogenase